VFFIEIYIGHTHIHLWGSLPHSILYYSLYYSIRLLSRGISNWDYKFNRMRVRIVVRKAKLLFAKYGSTRLSTSLQSSNWHVITNEFCMTCMWTSFILSTLINNIRLTDINIAMQFNLTNSTFRFIRLNRFKKNKVI
jgi:hypothetical protein